MTILPLSAIIYTALLHPLLTRNPPHKNRNRVTDMASPPLSLISIFLLFSIASATVPSSDTFRYVNEGGFGDYIVEYGGTYRMISISSSPFQMGFYNTTPNAYTLALRIGSQRQEPFYRWVWEANRNNPVGENATLTFGTDGNLVLAHADGRVAWESGTANKGVTGSRLLPNGNWVLHDAAGKFIWQSFDQATDTLLVGQSIRVGSRLVSRASDEVNKDGSYSLVFEPKRFAMYYKGEKTPKPLLYFAASDWFDASSSVQNVTFDAERYPEQGNATELGWRSGGSGLWNLARPKYDATYSFLRIGQDGNLRIFTYNTKVDYQPNEVTFTLFAREPAFEDFNECQLPERCGGFGVCEDSQCVACPTPNGLTGWSKDCRAPIVSSCGANAFYYYKVVGVDHFLTKYNRGDGPITVGACEGKCTKDCKCSGYFYNEDTSRCWIAYELKTLTRVSNSTHLGFIKAPKA